MTSVRIKFVAEISGGPRWPRFVDMVRESRPGVRRAYSRWNLVHEGVVRATLDSDHARKIAKHHEEGLSRETRDRLAYVPLERFSILLNEEEDGAWTLDYTEGEERKSFQVQPDLVGLGKHEIADDKTEPVRMSYDDWHYFSTGEVSALLGPASSRKRLPDFWRYKSEVYAVSGAKVNEEEVKLRIKHAWLKRHRELDRMQQVVKAFDNFDRVSSSRRERIPEDVRRFVWQRDEGKCVRCGRKDKLEFDHIIPVAEGGSNTERNLQLLCESCNRSKGKTI